MRILNKHTLRGKQHIIPSKNFNPKSKNPNPTSESHSTFNCRPFFVPTGVSSISGTLFPDPLLRFFVSLPLRSVPLFSPAMVLVSRSPNPSNRGRLIYIGRPDAKFTLINQLIGNQSP